MKSLLAVACLFLLGACGQTVDAAPGPGGQPAAAEKDCGACCADKAKEGAKESCADAAKADEKCCDEKAAEKCCAGEEKKPDHKQ